MSVDRRTFLTILGLTAAGTALGGCAGFGGGGGSEEGSEDDLTFTLGR